MDSSYFDAALVGIKDTTEDNQALCYKLRMLVIEVEGETNVFFNNKGVCINSFILEQKINKNHNLVAYHEVHWE